MTKAHTFKQASLFVTVATGASLLAGAAMAQMYEKPYGFAARDRAGLAVYMKNLDESRNNSGTVTSGAGAATYLVCGGGGGGGSASSTANSSCIIVNNSDASLGIGQASDGSQDSNAETETTTTTADEVSNILNQSTTSSQ